MRTLIISITSAAVLLALMMFMPSRADEPRNELQTMLGSEQFESCGLHKLTPDEQHRLCGMVTGCVPQSYVETAAMRYLEKNGWVKVRVVGAVPVKDDGLHGLALNEYVAYELDPIMSAPIPEPGIHWAKITGSSWTVLREDGGEDSFWAKKLE